MASVLVLLYFPLGYALPTPDVQRVPRALGTGNGGSNPDVKVIVSKHLFYASEAKQNYLHRSQSLLLSSAS